MENVEYGRVRIIQEWLDWDYSIHEEQEQINRQGWAMNYPFIINISKNSIARNIH